MNGPDYEETSPNPKPGLLKRTLQRATRRPKDKNTAPSKDGDDIAEKALGQNGATIGNKVEGKDDEDLGSSEENGNREVSTSEGAGKTPHDLETQDWQKLYVQLEKESEQTQNQLNRMEDEYKNFQSLIMDKIAKKAKTFAVPYDDPLSSSLSQTTEFWEAIETLLSNYEMRLKDNNQINARYRSEHDRVRVLDDQLQAKKSDFDRQWAIREKDLWKEHARHQTDAYHKGAADEQAKWADRWDKRESEITAELSSWTAKWNNRESEFTRQKSSWTTKWNKRQSEIEAKLTMLKQEQHERRELEAKVKEMKTQLTDLKFELETAKRESKHNLDESRKASEAAELNFKAELSSLEEKHQTDAQLADKKHEEEIEQLKKDLEEKYERQMLHTETVHEQEDEKRENEFKVELDGVKSKLRGEMDILQGNHVAEINFQKEQHAQQVSGLEAQIESLKEAHAEGLSSQEARSKSELSKERDKITSLRLGHARELKMNKDAHTKDVSRLNSEILSLREKHSVELRTKSSTQATELMARDQIHAEEELKLKDRMRSLEVGHSADMKSQGDTHAAALKSQADSHAAAMSKLKKQFREHLAQREQEHAEVTSALRATIGEYSGTLLDRDKVTYNMFEGKPFEPLLDAEIETRFVSLVEEVTTLSRLEWMDRPRGWPEPILLRLSGNQKTLKRQILADTIWVILHEHVFCSPFRVFGEEGRVLEAKWNEECGADDSLNNGLYVWPKPSMKTERWRYITIRECRAALQKPNPSSYDPLAKPRKGFQTSVKTIKDELVDAVGRLVDLDQTHVQDLGMVAMRAARTWLEFGLQRCRINVHMQGDNIRSVREKIERLEDGWTLVVAPRLEKFGSAKGDDLDEKVTVGELEGEVETLKL